MRCCLVFTLITAGILIFVHPASASDHWLGMGVHYWEYIDDIDIDDFEDSGSSWVVSYLYKPDILGLQLDLEFAEDQIGAIDEWTYTPQAYVIAGGMVYGGLGGGIHYADGESSDPFFALKAGVLLGLFPNIHLDINANYRFENWDIDEVEEDVDTNTVTLGAVMRFEF